MAENKTLNNSIISMAENKTLNDSIISIRVALQNSNIKQTGYNKFGGFPYFELSDFLPKLNELMSKEGMNDIFTIETNINETMIAKLTLIKGEETQEYKMPFKLFETPLTFKKDNKGNLLKNPDESYIQVPSMQDIQYLGALNTYYKRYLYQNAFGITDGEVIDAMDENNLGKKGKTTTVPKASVKQVEMLSQVYVGENLKKLLEKNGIEKLEDLSSTKASELIKSIIGKSKAKEETKPVEEKEATVEKGE